MTNANIFLLRHILNARLNAQLFVITMSCHYVILFKVSTKSWPSLFFIGNQN